MTVVRHTIRTADGIVDAGLAPASRHGEIARVAGRYAVAITPAMAELVDKKDPLDPIARQFVPDARELHILAGENADPIGDHLKSPVRGLVHRYRDRVLLKAVGVCPVYCRFCFRREMVGPAAGQNLTPEEISSALAYISERPHITEVILTGGDPLMLSARRIEELTRAISDIAHVSVIRWHTRVPIVAPERVAPELVRALTSTSRHVIAALHTNHPRELTAAAEAAISRISEAGVTLISQSVLLKGINDDAATLEPLMRVLVQAGVRPYYLHHGDLAPGTAHFRTTIEHGQQVMRQLRQRLPAHAVPSYVLDIPGAHGKIAIEFGSQVRSIRPGCYSIRDAAGIEHIYEDARART